MAFTTAEVIKKLEQQLKCPVCLERYNHPKTLPCLHSLCHDCLCRFPVAVQRGSEFITCPVCRNSTQLPDNGVSGFQSAFFLNDLLELYEVLKKFSTTQNVCDNCHRGHAATGYCKQCSMLLCQTCIDMHNRWTPFTSHQVVGMDDVASTAMLSISKSKTLGTNPFDLKNLIKEPHDKIPSLQMGSEENVTEWKEQVQKLKEELRVFQEKHDRRIADKNYQLQKQQEVLDEKLNEMRGLQKQQKAMQNLIDTLNKENSQLKQQVLQTREENARYHHHRRRSPCAPRRHDPHTQTGAPRPQHVPSRSADEKLSGIQKLIDTLNEENSQLKQQVLQTREENGRHHYHHQHRSPGAPRRHDPHTQTGAPRPQHAPSRSAKNSQLKQQVLQTREENARYHHHRRRSPCAPRRHDPHAQTGAPRPEHAPCPVCQLRFPRTTNQIDIERHMNAHFDV